MAKSRHDLSMKKLLGIRLSSANAIKKSSGTWGSAYDGEEDEVRRETYRETRGGQDNHSGLSKKVSVVYEEPSAACGCVGGCSDCCC